MPLILLYGTGTNWLPLLYPAILIICLIYSGGFLIRYFKKRKLYRENRLIERLSRHRDYFGEN